MSESDLCENISKVKDFCWDETLEDEDGTVDLVYDPDDVSDCAKELCSTIIDSLHINYLHFADDGILFIFHLDPSFHWLTAGRFCSEWTLTSRLKMWKLLVSETLSLFSTACYLEQLLNKIREVYPATEKQIVFKSLLIFDDSVVMIGGNNHVIDVELRCSLIRPDSKR